MHRRHSAYRSTALLIAGFTCLLSVGCNSFPIPGLEGASPARPDGAGAILEDARSNDAFELAQSLDLPLDGELTIEGAIEGRTDVDIYSLGPGQAGERITADVRGQGGINLVAAVFDADKDLYDANDDRNYYAGQLDPYITHVIRRATDNLYLAVAVTRGTQFASSAGRFDQGAYSARIIRKPNQVVARPRRQYVWVDFRGGASVQISLQPFETMRAFSAEAISARFSGQTQRMADLIIDHMRRDYADFDVVLLDSRHDAPPAGPYTKLYFGNYNPAYLGLSDSVDTINTYLDQDAIIYSEDFALFEGLLPSLEEVAQALANTGSHELGHLLGLEHTGESADVMATAASARQILETDCLLRRSRLEIGVFPAGWQNGYDLVMQNVGPGAGLAEAGRSIGIEDLLPPHVNTENTWREAVDIQIPMCGRCVLDQPEAPARE